MDANLKSICATAIAGLAIAAATGPSAYAAGDPLLSSQWALADPSPIGAEEAWTQSTGTGVLVAILDTGVQLDHPDLAANIWTNPGEIAANGRDDDNDGIVDDIHGANMFDHTANVDDDNGHGTHVAGIVAARQGNGIGGTGIAPNAKILPVKILDANMAGNTDTLATGIRYAVDRGAKILNVSVNTDAPTDTVRDAVSYADAHGAITVASAGNNGRDIDLKPSYPASLTDPAVLSVAAIDEDRVLAAISNTGVQSVDIAAPGVHIASTAPSSSYQSRTGTSAAAPFVSGSLALLSAARPDLSMAALRSIVIDSSRHTSLLGARIGGGSLDVGAAMHRALTGRAWRSASGDDTTPTTATLRLRTPDRAGSRITLRWSATGAGAVARWRVSLDGRVVKTVSADTTVVTRRAPRAGRHTWRVVGFGADGTKVVAAKRAFRVARRG